MTPEEFLTKYGHVGTPAGDRMAQDLEAVFARATVSIPDRTHIVNLNFHQRRDLMKFLERPNGSFRTGENNRACIEAVEGGGVWIKTDPYRYVDPRTR